MSSASFRENDSNSTATTTHMGGLSRTRAKEVHLPPMSATWSVAVYHKAALVVEAATAATEMAASPSVASLTFTVEAEDVIKPFPFCCGLFKCTPRRMRIFLYLGSLLTAIISVELALYIWAMASTFSL